MRLLLIFRSLKFTVLTQAGGILDSLPELALAAQLNDTSEPEGSLKLSTDGLLLLLTSRVCVMIAFYMLPCSFVSRVQHHFHRRRSGLAFNRARRILRCLWDRGQRFVDCMYSAQISCSMTGVLLRWDSCSGFLVRHLYVSLASGTSCLRRWILRWSCELHRYTS